MGKIVISTNATLDGVVQDPDGQEGFKFGGWFHQFVGKDLEDWTANETKEALGVEALLLGRRSFEWFASRRPSQDVRVSRKWADRMNSLPKYVVSSTLEHPQWSNTTVLKGGAVKEISELKRKVDGEILVYGTVTPQRLWSELATAGTTWPLSPRSTRLCRTPTTCGQAGRQQESERTQLADMQVIVRL
jgi:dihydrofolate reductase